MTLKQVLFDFLNKNCQPFKPILLGLSGGPDSLVLFDLLLKYKKEKSFSFGIAHIDHCWRTESSVEADQLARMAESHGIPFHLKVLNPSELKGNLEAACRQERLDFFSELCHQQGYQAVILGHHADDQAETVLKKVLEGSSLPYLSGLQFETCVRGLKLWRPFLNVRKAEILAWVKLEKLNPILDATNTNPKYLRARFRTKIIPSLSQEFGKNLTDTLSRVGSEAYELKLYLNEKLQLQLETIKCGPFGSYMDLTHHLPKYPLEIRYLIRRLCESENCFFSYTMIDTACEKLLANAANIQLQMGNYILIVDRRRLFLLKQFPRYDQWRVETNSEGTLRSGLSSIWEGNLGVNLAGGSHYSIVPARMQERYYGRGTLDDWWTECKVPAFLRQIVPVIYDGKQICHEFLTGKCLISQDCDPQTHFGLVFTQN